MDYDQCLLGIDFGTSYSCIAAYKEGGLVIIPNGVGERTTPSVVIFEGPDKVFVGEETLYHLPKTNKVKIYEIKRLLGRKYSEIKNMLNYFPFKIIEENNNNRPKIQINFGNLNYVEYYPEEIASLILKKLIDNAESFLNQKIRNVLITVPADFNENQKTAVRFSAERIEGVRVLQVINEPCAAVLAYGFPKLFIQNKFIPFNKYFSLVQSNNVFHPMEEMSINSSTKFEISVKNSEEENIPFIEDDLTNNNEEVINSINNNINISSSNNENVIKCSLISQNKDLMKIIVFDLGGGTYDVSLVYVEKDKTFETKGYNGDQKLGGSDFDNKLIDYSLKDFCDKKGYDENEIRQNYKCMQRLKRACEETKKYLSVINEDTILIEDFFDSNPLCCPITRSKFEDLCKDLFKRLIKPIDLLLEKLKLKNTDINEIILVGGSSKIPKVKEIISKKFENVPINDQINPDEAVAYGAIIYAESLRRFEGEFWKDFNYLDKTGHSYGIEIEDGTVKVILPKGIKYPTSRYDFFETFYNYQYTFDVRVFEGENKFANQNTLIGEFTIEGIPQRPKGEVILEVTMSIDENQEIKVSCLVNEGNNIKNELIINRRNQFPNIENSENIILSVNSELNNEEVKKQAIIFEYTKDFNNQKNYKEKFELIKKYNEAVVDYLNFFEINYKDTSSEKYLYLLDKLFKSYTYFFKTNLRNLVDIGEKGKIKENIELFLKKISIKAPFRIKQLLDHFKSVKTSYFQERLDIFVFSMELLYNKALDNFNKKEKNHVLFAKTLFEESLIISNTFIQKNEQCKMFLVLMRKYKDIVEDCQKKIKLISATSLSEIEELKIQGKLFDNKKNLEKDDLSFLSLNLDLAIKKINTIENLRQNKQALETKSFYLANIVKIEFLKNEPNINLASLDKISLESISIAEKLDLKDKPWFKEIVDLRKIIENKMICDNPAPPIENIVKFEEKFETLINRGNEELLRYILDNYPYNGHKSTDESIGEYKKNKRKFLLNLRRKYNNIFGINQISINLSNNSDPKLNNKILEFINKMIDNVDN